MFRFHCHGLVLGAQLGVILALVGRCWSCDDLVPEQCLLPFPNSFYLTEDNTTDTGFRLDLTKDDFPPDILGSHPLPGTFNSMDGFSPFPSILAYFPSLSSENLPPHWDIAQSLQTNCTTVLLNADTGELVPHFAELDENDELSLEHALMMWPAHRLNDNTRYIVAIRGLVNKRHDPVQSSKTFLALRDGLPAEITAVDDRRSHFEEIFSILGKAGIERNNLQLAWDFHTASRKCLTERLLFTRDDAFERIENICPSYNITKITDNYSADIFRHIEGTFTVPYYTNHPGPGSHLVIGADGLPVFQGVTQAEFEVLIPRSLVPNATYTPPSPGRILQYGHGLFGSHDEVQQGYLQGIANQHGYVMAACTWWGMSRDDVVPLVLTLATNLSNSNILPDRLTQGVTNALLLMKLMKGSFSHDAAVMFGKEAACYDPAESYYYGNSLGGIIGSVYMAVTREVTRGVLGVGGGPFGLLLPRSRDFSAFAVGIHVLYPRSMDYIGILALLNTIWSRCAPSGYMSSITSNPLPGTYPHQILMQYGLGDAQVNILAVQSLARTAGCSMFQSNVRQEFNLPDKKTVTEKLFGFQLVADSAILHNASLVQGLDPNALPEPYDNVPPSSKTDSHEKPRRFPAFQAQLDHFLSTGEIRNFCGNPPGACHETP